MSQEIKNKFIHLAQLVKNPLADQNNIQRLNKELEWINVANFTQEDWQLYHSVYGFYRGW